MGSTAGSWRTPSYAKSYTAHGVRRVRPQLLCAAMPERAPDAGGGRASRGSKNWCLSATGTERGVSKQKLTIHLQPLSRTEPETPGADVRREAAHNLALIYRRSGSEQLARKVLRAHFTV